MTRFETLADRQIDEVAARAYRAAWQAEPEPSPVPEPVQWERCAVAVAVVAVLTPLAWLVVVGAVILLGRWLS